MDNTIGIAAAFGAGILSFISPCILPLVPAYLSYLSAVSAEDIASGNTKSSKYKTGIYSTFFVLGFSLIFILLGAGASWLGQMLTGNLEIIIKISGIVIIIFGIHTLGIFKINSLFKEKRFIYKPQKIGLTGAFLIGIMFAFGWTPCIGPILSAIIALAANSDTLWQGIILLTSYSIGLGIPFIITGFASGAIFNRLKIIKKYYRQIEIISGILLIVIGIMIFTGSFQSLTGKTINFFS